MTTTSPWQRTEVTGRTAAMMPSQPGSGTQSVTNHTGESVTNHTGEASHLTGLLRAAYARSWEPTKTDAWATRLEKV